MGPHHPPVDTPVANDVEFSGGGWEFRHHLNKDWHFQPSQFRFFTEGNRVDVLNQGDTFLTDFTNEVEGLRANDHVMLTNYKINTDLHMTGSLSCYGLGHSNIGEREAETELKKIVSAENSIAVECSVYPVTPHFFKSIPNIDSDASNTIFSIWSPKVF